MSDLSESPNDVAESDIRAFLEALSPPDGTRIPTGRPLLEPGRPASLARAPGRLDVMGGIADYSGSLVLQWPIREATCAAVQESTEGTLRMVSLPATPEQPAREVVLSADQFSEVIHGDYQATRRLFQEIPKAHWASYIAGPLAVLARERLNGSLGTMRGLTVVVRSAVPEGKGVSSSAALEVATMLALAGLFDTPLEGIELAKLCQCAENFVVGAPCGIMDQMTSALGQPHQLLALLCQPAEVRGFLPVPPSIGFWGVDSGIRHAVTGSDYASVRTGAFMGYRILGELMGQNAKSTGIPGVVQFEKPPWNGYLANLDPGEFASRYESELPETMSGQVFLDQFDGTTDLVTRVDPSRIYAVRQPTAHPIFEHARVRQFGNLLTQASRPDALLEMGEIMFASHASYSACGLGSSGTDHIVELVKQSGPDAGLFGAKITGGGSGGTVAILGRSDAGPAVAELARRYTRESGLPATVFSGSSPGATVIGPRRIKI